MWSPAALVAPIVVAFAMAGCASSSTSTSSNIDVVTTTSALPQPAGPTPSRSAKMICSEEGRRDIADGLGVVADAVTSPSWIDHNYACQYSYPDVVISLSVKELDDAYATERYFDALATLLGRQSETLQFGQGAFITRDGSVVVRKDWKVLLVDVSRVAPRFGSSRLLPADVATSIAAAIMGCWNGS
jgi:hypothetical protein